jgi:3-dehydroquinate synthase
MTTVSVDIGAKHYPIHLGRDLIDHLGHYLTEHQIHGPLFVITDDHVDSLYGKRMIDHLTRDYPAVHMLSVPEGESSKSLSHANELYTRLIQRRATRDSVILAFGGGVVGDLAGFVAATFMRGIRLIQIPTTLLAQVDSSVGGKVGVNHDLGKNLIGAFHQPEMVFIDTGVLSTLELRQRRAGAAEIIKYGLIADPGFLHTLHNRLEDLIYLRDAVWVESVLETCCRLKADVVSQDEREAGLRAILNFGHTIGHALEAITHYQTFLHGEAVAYGMLAALQLSRIKYPRLSIDAACELIRRLDMPPVPEWITADMIIEALGKDKKRRQSGQTWVMLEELGQARLDTTVSPVETKSVIDTLLDSVQTSQSNGG